MKIRALTRSSTYFSMAGHNLNHSNPGSPLVLALDTSYKATSIALARGDQLFAEFEGPMSEERSESLWDAIRVLLDQAGCSVRDVDLYAVATGPGAFTGLRIGVAAAKGLAAAMEKPIAGITSLELLAYSLKPAGRVCAVMNGYRGEIYWQTFAFDSDSLPVPLGAPRSTDIPSMLGEIEETVEVVVGGDGAEELSNTLKGLVTARGAARPDAGAGMPVTTRRGNRAARLAELAQRKFAAGMAESAATVRACYVRPAEAEIKLARGMLGLGMGREPRSADKSIKAD